MKSACDSAQNGQTCFPGKGFAVFRGVLQNISAGVIYATVPKTGKRVLWEKVLPFLGGSQNT
jgi:hypothetical protein